MKFIKLYLRHWERFECFNCATRRNWPRHFSWRHEYIQFESNTVTNTAKYWQSNGSKTTISGYIYGNPLTESWTEYHFDFSWPIRASRNDAVLISKFRRLGRPLHLQFIRSGSQYQQRSLLDYWKRGPRDDQNSISEQFKNFGMKSKLQNSRFGLPDSEVPQ